MSGRARRLRSIVTPVAAGADWQMVLQTRNHLVIFGMEPRRFRVDRQYESSPESPGSPTEAESRRCPAPCPAPQP